MLKAAIDTGTNSVKCLVANFENGRIGDVLLDARRATRLGEGLRRNGALLPEAMDRTCRAITAFANEARALGASEIIVAGTSALREAANADDLVRCVRKTTGCALMVLSEDDEERLSFAGATSASAVGPTAVADIGGGSTECIVGDDGGIQFHTSLPVGAVRLTESMLPGDPPAEADIRHARRHVRESLRSLPSAPGCRVIGVGGTFHCMASGALEARGEVEGFYLGRAEIERQLNLYSSNTSEAIGRLPGIEEGWEDILLAGSLIAAELLDCLGHDGVTVTRRGLRHGLLLME
jgi:exopolyphosphatase / guanosine-5'-triphosphate,3'-diphosphate pyrophosphatase